MTTDDFTTAARKRVIDQWNDPCVDYDPIDTEALRRLADRATSAPWSAMDFEPDPEDWGTPILGGGERGTMQAHMIGYAITVGDEAQCDADAAFIAAARTAVPALLDALAAAEHRATRAERTAATGLAALRAAFTPPPTRPEGAEEIERLLAEAWETSIGKHHSDAETYERELADFLAERGVRVTGAES